MLPTEIYLVKVLVNSLTPCYITEIEDSLSSAKNSTCTLEPTAKHATDKHGIIITYTAIVYVDKDS